MIKICENCKEEVDTKDRRVVFIETTDYISWIPVNDFGFQNYGDLLLHHCRIDSSLFTRVLIETID